MDHLASGKGAYSNDSRIALLEKRLLGADEGLPVSQISALPSTKGNATRGSLPSQEYSNPSDSEEENDNVTFGIVPFKKRRIEVQSHVLGALCFLSKYAEIYSEGRHRV